MASKNYNWLKEAVLPLSFAIMMTCWLSSWMLWVSSWPFFTYQGPVLSPLAMAAVLIVSTHLTRTLLRHKWAGRRAQMAIGSAGVVAILLFLKWEYYGDYPAFDSLWLTDLGWSLGAIFKGIPPQLTGLLLGAYLWWRGISLGRRSIEFSDILKAFQVGIVMLAVLLIFSAVSIRGEELRLIQQQAIPSVLTFFFFSLLALSLSRLEAAREEARLRQGKRLGFSRDWLLVAVASIVAIVLIGFLVTSIFSFDLASRLLEFLLRFFELAMIPVYLFFLLFGYFLQYIIYFIKFVQYLFHLVPQPLDPGAAEVTNDPETLKKTAEAVIPPWIIQATEWLLLVAIIALVVYVFVMAINRLQRVDKNDVEETRESLWSWQTFLADLKALLRSLWRRVAIQRKKTAAAIMPYYYRTDPQYHISVSIRQIYHNLLSYASRLGYAKGLDQTPYEYLRVVEAALPREREDLLVITEAYVKARYSGQPAMDSEFEVVNQAWTQVRFGFSKVEEERKGKRS
ncbi:MAG: DUF4129 domain-containing protein [Dehalococcoidia bacterium]|nr:DUF4129 domain-containing protein [Dehalococcoidia bacterium]